MSNGNEKKLRLRVRFDYRGEGKQGRLFSRGREGEDVAEEIREQRAILLRNIPVQGVRIEEIDTNGEIYVLYDEASGREVAYAPVEFTMEADTIEDVIPFLLRDEFRKVEVISPNEVSLDRHEVERIIYKINEELRNYRLYLERRLNSK
ncbi:MAG: hypothetical protein PWP44_1326 [Thermacetogenium sp.]|jgi:hypothetical protein|uniref:Uncharacterized protein n=1 Tax=Thermacetogenium phaeum TaxID=85874 RepID=A0A101FGX7_9THEO|nr:MAG: Uncharacterized protein XD66_0546 [Thermacetogenium phaeum]MDN5366120.1 hypothetical protein [Thermacetogenium sp.]